MEVTSYKDIPFKSMPTTVYSANCSFNSNNLLENRAYAISGTYNKVVISGIKQNNDVGIAFITEDANLMLGSLFIYSEDNPNKIFTTEQEAIAWSKHDRGYIS